MINISVCLYVKIVVVFVTTFLVEGGGFDQRRVFECRRCDACQLRRKGAAAACSLQV